MQKRLVVGVGMLLMVSGFLTSPVFVFAQTSSTYTNLTSSLGQGGLSMSMSPQYPAPGQIVSFSLQDLQDNLDTATIAWSVNGAVMSTGAGITTFQTTAGTAGSSQTVSANVTTQAGANISQSATISPAGVDLLWQARSYVPPFYQGKALFPFQGTVTITAMPTFALSNPQNAEYSWKLDDGAMPNVSGVGKNTITLTGSILLKPINVSVTATSNDGSLIAQNTITLSGTDPMIILYQESPLYGFLLNEAVGQQLSLSGQIGLNAAPYFFDSTAPYQSAATFQWDMNDEAISNQTGQVLDVAPPSGQSGNSTLSVAATNSAKPFQTSSATINVSFASTQ